MGAFAKLRKATIRFVMYLCVCLSSWNSSTPTGRIFVKFHFRISRKSVKNIQISLKSDKNNAYFTYRPM